MPFETTEALLKDLGWPERDMDRRGAMSWATVLRDESNQVAKATASIVVEDSTLTLRLDTDRPDLGTRNLLEATWALNPSVGPTLTFATQSGAPITPDENRLLNEFKDRVNQMGVLPHFQPMAPRNMADSPRRSPGL